MTTFNAEKAKQLGDFLSLFNHPQGVPQTFIQQVPAGQAPTGGPPPQGMVQVSTVPQQQYTPEPQYVQQPAAPQQPQYTQQPAQPQAQPIVQQPAQPQQGTQVPGGSVGTSVAGAQDIQTLLAQNEAYRNQLAAQAQKEAEEAQRRQQEEISRMKPMEQVNAKLDLLQNGLRVATERTNQYHIAYEREKLMNQYEGQLDPSRLDLSSVEALHNSVPGARQSYAEFENRVAQKLASQYGLQQHFQVEGLPPAPQIAGMPSSNRAGAVPVGPPQAQAPQYAQHPMVQQDNVLMRSANPAYGRVYTPQPGALPNPQPGPNGQYFQTAFPQPAHAPQQQYASPQVQFVQAGQQGALQAAAAPGADDAVAAAQSAVMAARKGGLSKLRAMGLAEPASTSMANSSAGGAQRTTHAQMPNPAMFAGHGAALHPMTLAS